MSEKNNDIQKSLSGLRPSRDAAWAEKGHRPLQEGNRPAQGATPTNVGPMAQQPGTGVPKKPSQ